LLIAIYGRDNRFAATGFVHPPGMTDILAADAADQRHHFRPIYRPPQQPDWRNAKLRLAREPGNRDFAADNPA